jgi:hypothetical protein
MLAGSAAEATNVAPWSMIARTGLPDFLGATVRVMSVVVALAAVVGAVAVVRRSGDLVLAAALCSVAMLLLPAALWYHYLVVLLPLAIMAWPHAGSAARLTLVVSALSVSAGVAWLPLATIGWLVMATAIVVALIARPLPGRVEQPILA